MSWFRGARGALAVLAVVAAVVAVGVPSAVADTGFHGIAFNKGCDSPTLIGQPYSCAYQIVNGVDTLHDTLQVNGLSDQVHSAGGDVNSGPILSSLQLVFSSPSVSCTGGSGAGTVASPYVGATSCLIPFNQSITTNPFSFYTAQANDFNLPGHSLTDTATLAWNDTCNVSDTTPPPRNCTTGAQSASAGSASEIDKLPSATSTTIHNAAHGPVTVVEAGSTVHDFVTVTGVGGQPNPSGNVTIDWFTSQNCNGPVVSTSAPIALNAAGTVDATGFAQGPLTAGFYGFIAHYGGDGTYLPSNGACEPLQVVDANIQLTPATATNPVGTNHVLTCHINVNDGSGQVNAPAGTVCTVNIIAGPGTPASQNCTTVGATGSCTVTITSATTGMSTLQASTSVSVAGLVLQRQTGDAHVGDGPNAQKQWVDANIAITPANATNPTGTNHVLTITVNALGGTIDPGPHTATASIVSGPGSFVGGNTCTYTGGAATASCTVTITSLVAGTTVVSATSDIPVGGVTITRTTGTAANTASGGSGNASKLWIAPDDTIVTHVRDAANNDITNQTVAQGTVIHDEATVTRTAGTPAAVPDPTGTVDFTLFNGNSCSGTPIASGSQAGVPLGGGGVAVETTTFTAPSTGGDFSYLAHYNGDANYPAKNAACEPFSVTAPQFGPRLTPGFWKNHQAATTALLPISLGNYVVDTFAKAAAIFDAMKCSAPINCLAAHLLAAKLDLKGGSDPSIQPTIDKADAFLSGGVADGVTGVNYTGVGNYTLTAAQKAEALALEAQIDAYTNQ